MSEPTCRKGRAPREADISFSQLSAQVGSYKLRVDPADLPKERGMVCDLGGPGGLLEALRGSDGVPFPYSCPHPFTHLCIG